MIEKRLVRTGMTVYSADGHKLGKVVECDANTFIVEKGYFFPKDFVARYDDVAGASGDDLRLSRGRDALAEIGSTPREGTYSEGSSLLGPSGGIETAPSEEGPGVEKPAVVEREARHRRERTVERRAAGEEGGEAQRGEDPGKLGPTRREPEE